MATISCITHFSLLSVGGGGDPISGKEVCFGDTLVGQVEVDVKVEYLFGTSFFLIIDLV